jgi:hypothetical protein
MTTPTTPMPTPSVRPDVAAFVAAVRAQLDDLSSEEITELTGGLEADLTDELAEAGESPRERYGDPVEYARELRSAAGLPPRRRGRSGPGLDVWFRTWLTEVQAEPWWPHVRDFVVTLRPAWWVLRAWILLEGVLRIFFGGQSGTLLIGGPLGFLLLMAAVVLSVEAGRRLPTLDRRRQTAVTVVNVLAVLALVPVLVTATANRYVDGDSYVSDSPSGLVNNGEAVSNVFPYDAQGHPLTGVQLYDQNGRPIEVAEGDRTQFRDDGTEVDLVPGSQAGTPQRWNAFPLKESEPAGQFDENGNPVRGAVHDAQLPFAAVPPLLAAPSATPEATPTETPTPKETLTPKETPTSTETPAPTATKR